MRSKDKFIWNIAATAKSLQLCPTLCDPINRSPPGSPIPGIFQLRTLEWAAISFSNLWKWKVKSEIEVTQLYPTLSDPMDCSPPGSSIHGIFQARVLECSAIAFSNLVLIIFYSELDQRLQNRTKTLASLGLWTCLASSHWFSHQKAS